MIEVFKLLVHPVTQREHQSNGNTNNTHRKSSMDCSNTHRKSSADCNNTHRKSSVDCSILLALTRFFIALAGHATLTDINPYISSEHSEPTESVRTSPNPASIAAYVRPVAGICVWHLLPLLCSHQRTEVIDSTIQAIRALLPLDAPLIHTILRSVGGHNDAQGGDKSLWMAVITEPRIAAACPDPAITRRRHHASVNSGPHVVAWADKCWRAYTVCDPHLAGRIRARLLSTKESSPAIADARWAKQLQGWGHV
jgi:hypothetical protein